MTFRELKKKRSSFLSKRLCKKMKNAKSTSILFLAMGSKLFAEFRFPCGRGELEFNPAKSEHCLYFQTFLLGPLKNENDSNYG
jgi:hypothetical protein